MAIPPPQNAGPRAFDPEQRKNIAWFHWPDRPLVSPAELHLVPGGSAADMLKNYAKVPQLTDEKTVKDLLAETGLLDAVQVRSPFFGMTVPSDDPKEVLGIRTGIYEELGPRVISRYREPGRVNLNTVNAADVWHAVTGGRMARVGDAFLWDNRPDFKQEPVFHTLGGLMAMKPHLKPDRPPAPGDGPPPKPDIRTPQFDDGETLKKALEEAKRIDFNGNGVTDATVKLPTERNPWHQLYTANRLANTATIRSHMFAVWITVRATNESEPDAQPRFFRGFYVIDRSIPVGFEDGVNHNADNVVVLRRTF